MSTVKLNFAKLAELFHSGKQFQYSGFECFVTAFTVNFPHPAFIHSSGPTVDIELSLIGGGKICFREMPVDMMEDAPTQGRIGK